MEIPGGGTIPLSWGWEEAGLRGGASGRKEVWPLCSPAL